MRFPWFHRQKVDPMKQAAESRERELIHALARATNQNPKDVERQVRLKRLELERQSYRRG